MIIKSTQEVDEKSYVGSIKGLASIIWTARNIGTKVLYVKVDQ